MRILLLPTKSNYPYQAPDINVPGMGLPYLASALRASGHEVSAVNINYGYCIGGTKNYLEMTLRKALAEFQPELIGTGGLSADYLFVRDAIEIIRKCDPNIPVVGGGGLFSGDLEYIFKDIHPDFAVIGEGEETLINLVKSIKMGTSLSGVKGIAYWQNGEMILNEKAAPIQNIDSLNFPDYDLFDIEKYFSLLNHRDHHLNCRTKETPRLMSVMASRSCPFECTFCFHTMGSRYRSRSIEKVIEEINSLYEKYHINIVYLYDELFSVKKDRIYLFCDLLKKLNLGIHWTSMLRVTDIDSDVLKVMKDAGCTHVSWGFESASPLILKSMKKNTAPEQIRRTIEESEKAGLGVQAGFIYGDPAENSETIKTTQDFFNSFCKDHIVNSFYITPFPGSEIFSYCMEKGVIRDRKAYYESIHLRPVYNMTSMPQKTFHKLLDPIVRFRFDGIKRATEIEFKSLESKDFSGREIFMIDVQCPHCMKTINYRYPFDHNKSITDLLNVLTPVELYCSQCGKRFIAPTIKLTGFENEYKEYIDKINILEESFKPVVIIPVIGEIALQNHQFYGFNYEKLNISAFMDPGGPEGTTFIDYPSIGLSENNVLQNINCDFIIAPCENYQRYLNFLKNCGVPQENIYYLKINEGSNKNEIIKGTEDNSPKLIEEGYCGFNIVLYNEEWIGCRQSLGPLNLADISPKKKNRLIKEKDIIIGNSYNELISSINSSCTKTGKILTMLGNFLR